MSEYKKIKRIMLKGALFDRITWSSMLLDFGQLVGVILLYLLFNIVFQKVSSIYLPERLLAGEPASVALLSQISQNTASTWASMSIIVGMIYVILLFLGTATLRFTVWTNLTGKATKFKHSYKFYGFKFIFHIFAVFILIMSEYLVRLMSLDQSAEATISQLIFVLVIIMLSILNMGISALVVQDNGLGQSIKKLMQKLSLKKLGYWLLSVGIPFIILWPLSLLYRGAPELIGFVLSTVLLLLYISYVRKFTLLYLLKV